MADNNSPVRLILINVIVIIVLVGLLLGGYVYFTNSANYVSTSDAQVTGTIVPITVAYGGQLSSWNAGINTTVNHGEVLGIENGSSVLAMNPGLQQLTAHNRRLANKLTSIEAVSSPISGTIIQNNANVGQIVQPGQVLAEVVNLNQLNITANVMETAIRQVNIGQNVDISIAGIPNTSFKGVVQRIGQTTVAEFSLVPNLTVAQGSYTKVAQRIPVVISLSNGYSGQALVPGMSASVTIHISNS